MTLAIYNNGYESLGLVKDGEINGTWRIIRPDGTIFTRDYTKRSKYRSRSFLRVEETLEN